MIADILQWLVIALSLLNAGFMAFDGARALITGDYVRPRTGEHAGQLGPWAKLVEKIGIDPMSTLMKSIFLVFGLVGLFVTGAFAANVSWGWTALLSFNILCFWNLVVGTTSSALQVILLLVLRTLK